MILTSMSEHEESNKVNEELEKNVIMMKKINLSCKK